MFLLFYKLAFFLLTPFFSFMLKSRIKKGKEDYLRYREKLGIYEVKRPVGKVVWIHAASVGESLSAIPIVKDLAKFGISVVFTTQTLTSSHVLAKKLPKGSFHQFAPIDSPIIVKRFLSHFKPDVSIFIESEIWPVMITEAKKVSKSVLFLNARFSDGSIKKWISVKRFSRKIFSNFNYITTPNSNVVSFFNTLNIPVIRQPSLKYDALDLVQPKASFDNLKDRKVIVAVSTHVTEEEICLKCYKALKLKFSNLLLVLIPRHTNRVPYIENLIKANDLSYALRSNFTSFNPDSTDILIVDVMGEVIDFCNVAELCIVGGSFVDGIGGHNVLEPASLKKPIIYGPFHANFKDIALDMIEKNAIVISSKDSINQDAFAILSNSSKITQLSENAYSSFIENRGVSGKGVINEVLKFLI